MTPEKMLVARLEAASRRWWVARRLSALLTEAAARIEFLTEMERLLREQRDQLRDDLDAARRPVKRPTRPVGIDGGNTA
jgi:Spy/CpxP family protein refolding chaperone